MDSAWAPNTEPTVGLVGVDDESAPVVSSLEERLAETDGSLVAGPIDVVRTAAPSFVVAVGDQALTEIVATDPRVGSSLQPVLPVALSRHDALAREDLPKAVDAVLDGQATGRDRRLLSVTGPNETSRRGLFDVTLDTAEPARITEYELFDRSRSIARFRADGVVVATPAGSRGYARAVDGPILSPDLEAVVVAPIAPYQTDPSRWVHPPDRIAVSVERNETPVMVSVDGNPLETIAAEATVEITADGVLSTLVVPDEKRVE